MISFIKGTLVEVKDNSIVVENNGIGYLINSSYSTVDFLPSIGEDVILYTILIPREDSLTLYGFSTKEERSVFELLLTVSGVGPKAALSILGSLTISDLKFAVIGGDATKIAKTPGVGKKTAERVIIDLKDKIDFVDVVEGHTNNSKSVSKVSRDQVSSIRQEALDALVSLGYSSSTAAKALDSMNINENTDIETLLSDTLKQMSFL